MSNTNERPPEFVPSATFQGAKPGYYFGTSNQGTGYYLDRLQKQVAGKKRKRSVQIAEDQNEMRLIPSSSILEEAEKQAAGSTVLELTPKGIQSATNVLSKMAQQNSIQRDRFPDDPQQYMNSEVALYEQLTALQAVAANLTLYEYLVKNKTLIATLTELLQHDNLDIATATVGLFLEWVDPTLLSEQENSSMLPVMKTLASEVLLEAWEVIASNLSKYDATNTSSEQDENDQSFDGVKNSLSLMENLLDLDMMFSNGLLEEKISLSVAAYMVKNSNIVPWLFQQFETSSNIEEKARSVEILSLLSQKDDVFSILPDWSNVTFTTEKNRKTKSANGIEILLQAIGQYRKKQPQNEQELEILENSCVLLGSCIAFSTQNLQAFLDGQGIELVFRCLKERVHAGGCALKLIDFFGNEPIHKRACESLVTAGGLKYILPLLLASRIPNPASIQGVTKKTKKEWYHSIQAQVIRILYSMCRYFDDDSPEDAKVRFLSKFKDDERKCDRLVELLLVYDQKMRTAEYNFYLNANEDDETDEEFVQLAAMDAKLQGGGELFHRLGVTAAYVCSNSKKCHERILEQLQLQRSGMGLIKSSLQEFEAVLEDGSHQKSQVQSLIRDI